MIVRLVKLTLRPEEAGHFRDLFNGWRHRIIAFPGCQSLELLHGIHKKGVFFTRSEWESPARLEAYRNSAVFADVWPVVKRLFAEPAQAWSLDREHAMSTEPDKNTPPA